MYSIASRRVLKVWSCKVLSTLGLSANKKPGAKSAAGLDRLFLTQRNLRRTTIATPSNPLPSSSSEDGSGTTVTPDIPEIRGCLRS